MLSKVECFHCNDKKKINSFMKNKELIISNHVMDEKWAGKGMYLWDNKGNAKYWYDQKKRHVDESEIGIISMFLEYSSETLLDLTDLEQEKKCKKILDFFSKNNVEVSSKDPLGIKIDFICERLGYKTVKIMGYYEKTPTTGFLKKSKVSNKNKVIYCVKDGNSDILKNFRIIEV